MLGFGTVIQPSVTLLKKVILYSWRSQIPLRFALPPFDKGGKGGFSNSVTSKRGSKGPIRRLGLSFLGSAKGFEQAKSHVAMGRVLPSNERYFLPEKRQVQGPIDEQEHSAHLAALREVTKEQPDG